MFTLVEGGMPDTTFYPVPDLVRRKAAVYAYANGTLSKTTNGFGLGRAAELENVSKTLHAGGGGLFGTTKDYLALLRAVLRCDPRNPSPPARPILSAASYAEMWKPCVGTKLGQDKIAENGAAEHYHSPSPVSGDINHSVSFALVLKDSNNGRRSGTGTWAGAAHTQFWLDPVTGLAVSG
jgi:methyl acetate hydrolase